ncbi:MAG: NUDIX domain-containing protein [Clostridiaceae bacterium]|nr:NUDIX domain-containing protein [Eubacteriales bacterium]
MTVRNSSRAIVMNRNGDIFLFRFTFEWLNEETLWITPGGGLEEGETFEEALKRELYEELGLELGEDEYPLVFFRQKPFTMRNGGTLLSVEKYFLVRLDHADFSFEHFSDDEKRLTTGHKWWSVEELKTSSEHFFAEELWKLVEMVSKDIPRQPVEI